MNESQEEKRLFLSSEDETESNQPTWKQLNEIKSVVCISAAAGVLVESQDIINL